jgi:succinate dehydrogenase/fumarate reductase flavoprotein subunit
MAQEVNPQKWDEKVDIIVIGSGFAGLAAAIEAKIAGSSVIVLEKMNCRQFSNRPGKNERLRR